MVKINIFVRKFGREEDACYADLYRGGDYMGRIIADGFGINFQNTYIDEWCNWDSVTNPTVKKHMRDAARKALGCEIVSREAQLETRVEQLLHALELALTSGGIAASGDSQLNWNRKAAPTPKQASAQQQFGGAVSKEFRILGVNPSNKLLKPSEIMKAVKLAALVPPPSV